MPVNPIQWSSQLRPHGTNWQDLLPRRASRWRSCRFRHWLPVTWQLQKYVKGHGEVYCWSSPTVCLSSRSAILPRPCIAFLNRQLFRWHLRVVVGVGAKLSPQPQQRGAWVLRTPYEARPPKPQVVRAWVMETDRICLKGFTATNSCIKSVLIHQKLSLI